MSKEFKIEIKDDVKLNIDCLKLDKIFLKLKGKNKNKKIFNANIIIYLDKKSNKISIGEYKICKLEIENSEESSYDEYRNIYNNSCSFLSSSSCSSSNDNLKKIYKELNKFVKNIKFTSENNKVCSINFSLKNTHIKKMKLRGKLN